MSDLNERVDKLESRVNTMDKNLSVFQEVIKNFNTTIEKLSDSIDKFHDATDTLKLSLVQMQAEIKANTEDVEDLKKKVQAVDEKSKFDFLLWLRDKALPALLVGGLIFLVIKTAGG